MLRRTTLLFLLVAGLVVGSAPVAVAQSDDDKEVAEDSILTEDDVADLGLSEEAPDDELPPKVPECRTLRSIQKTADRAPNALSSFSDGGSTVVASKVVVYANERKANAAIDAYTADTATECLQTTLEKALSENLPKNVTAEFSGEATTVPIGDDSIVYQITITLTGDDGSTQDLFVELGLVRAGRGVAFLQFQAPDAPIATSSDLAGLVVDNLTSGLEDLDA